MSEAIINPHSVMGRGKSLINDYQIFVLRMWDEKGDGSSAVRLSVEDTHTGQRRGFTDWETMMQFLRQQLQPNG